MVDFASAEISYEKEAGIQKALQQPIIAISAFAAEPQIPDTRW